MLSERLKAETHEAHIDVEKLLVPRFKNLDNYAAYARLLKLFYGFFHPLEQQVELFVTPAVLPDIAERRKSAALLQDIAFVESDSATIPVSTELPEIASRAQALGAMYVIEGSTLGGVHLTRMISERLHLGPEGGINFFSGYRADTLAKWQQFQQQINALPLGAQDEIVRSANATFQKFKSWIEKN